MSRERKAEKSVAYAGETKSITITFGVDGRRSLSNHTGGMRER